MLARELDDELGEHVDLDVRDVRRAERLFEERHTLLDGEHRPLVGGVADDADDDAVEDLCRAADDVDVPVRHRVVAARADGDDRRAVAHGASNTVSCVEPCRRVERTGSGSSGSTPAAVSYTTLPPSASTRGRCSASGMRRDSTIS